MIRFIRLLFIIAIATNANAQTWEEWTQQKETQIKYLVEQIAVFQVHLGYVKKGYDIAEKGITTVQNIKNGEWNLHKEFFSSLKTVNPLIRNYTRVGDIIAIQARLVKRSKALIKECRQDGTFTSEEIAYLEKVCGKLFLQSLENIDELTLVITAGELEMKDGERIKRIEKIYVDMQSKQAFLQSYGSSMINLSKSRLLEKIEVELAKNLNDRK